MLRSDPSFNRLPQGEQQRLVRQLNNVRNMPAEQQQRRLARAENLEHLPVQDRMEINRSMRDWTTLPAQRQAMMRNAFRDLRSVPPDQRQTVLIFETATKASSPPRSGVSCRTCCGSSRTRLQNRLIGRLPTLWSFAMLSRGALAVLDACLYIQIRGIDEPA